MCEFEVILRPRRPQQFDRAERDPAAAVAGDAGRLVDREEILVLENHGLADLVQHGRGRGTGFRAFSHPHRRNPQLVADAEPGIGLGTLAVHTHLAGPQQPVDMRLRHPLQQRRQAVVHTLAIALGADGHGSHRTEVLGRSCRPH